MWSLVSFYTVFSVISSEFCLSRDAGCRSGSLDIFVQARLRSGHCKDCTSCKVKQAEVCSRVRTSLISSRIRSDLCPNFSNSHLDRGRARFFFLRWHRVAKDFLIWRHVVIEKSTLKLKSQDDFFVIITKNSIKYNLLFSHFS